MRNIKKFAEQRVPMQRKLMILTSALIVISFSLIVYTYTLSQSKKNSLALEKTSVELTNIELTNIELTEANNALKQRISIQQSALNNVLKNLTFENIPNCHFSKQFLGFDDLSIIGDPFKAETIIPKSVSIDGYRLIKIVQVDIEGILDVSIIDAEDQYVLSHRAKKIETPVGFDFNALFINDSGKICKNMFRFHYLPPMDVLGEFEKIGSFSSLKVLSKIGDDSSELTLPYGSTFEENTLLVTDCIHNNIKIFSSDGSFVRAFGSYGLKSGLFNGISDIQIFNDKLYVTESKNHRVSAFSLDGKFISSWGAFGEANEGTFQKPGYFNNPIGIDVNEDGIIVADHINNRIQSLAFSGGINWISGNLEDDTFDWKEPYYVKYDETRNIILVSNRSRDNIGVLNRLGEKIGTFGDGILSYPHELDVGADGRIYVADSLNNRLSVFSKIDNEGVKFINFPKEYGYIKTVSISEKGDIAVGFLNDRDTFVLLVKSDNEKLRNSSPLEQTLISNNQISFKTSPKLQAQHKYNQYCAICHEEGSFGAPITGNEISWERFPKKISKLTELAWAGKGAMVPKGGCNECSLQDLEQIIRIMAPMNWLENR